jgi:hypothetical protein
MTCPHVRAGWWCRWCHGFALVVLLLVGCGGGPPPEVQSALSVSAHGLEAIDGVLAPRYDEAAAECYDGSETRAAYDACAEPWDIAADARRMVEHTLRAAQLSHDAWATGADDDGPFLVAAACLAAALTELAEALGAVGVDMPPDLSSALALVQPYATGVCR